MRVLIVSGFLGAGKTTFIKELIRRTGEAPVILENEYGANDLDSRELSKMGELEILEFMEGCVCCTQKDSFSNTILSISASLDPDILVVEPTGVGKLSNVIENVRRVSYERIELLRPVCVVTPRSLGANLARYPEICLDQLRCAQTVVLSKTEREDEQLVEDACDRIREVNPDAEIVREHYTGKDDAWWRSLLVEPGQMGAAGHDDGNGHDGHGPDGHDHEHGHDDHEHGHDDHEHGHAHGEMEQLTVEGARIGGLGQLVALLEGCLRGRLGDVPRAKGVVRLGDALLRFDVADGLYGIIEEPDDAAACQCVFIGPHLEAEELRSVLGADAP